MSTKREDGVGHNPRTVTFEELKPTISQYLSEVYEFNVPVYQVERLREIFLRYGAQFMDAYFLPTIKKLANLKARGVPLHFNQKLIILLSPPLQDLSEGEFYFQAGVTTPGTISVKYQYQGKLHPTTMTDADLDRLVDSGLYVKLCKDAGLDRNVFESLVVRGVDMYHSVSLNDLGELVRASKAAASGIGRVDGDVWFTKGEVRSSRGLSFDSAHTDAAKEPCDVIGPPRLRSATDSHLHSLDILTRANLFGTLNSENETAATVSPTSLSPMRDIAPVRQPVSGEQHNMKPDFQRFPSERGHLVQQASTDHEDCSPASSTSKSDVNTSKGNLPYPVLPKDLADKAGGSNCELVRGASFSDQSDNKPYPDTASHVAFLATVPTACTTGPVQVEGGVCVEDGDMAISPGKEVDDLAAAVVQAAPPFASNATDTEPVGSPHQMVTAHQVQQDSSTLKATATSSSMQHEADTSARGD